MKIKQKYEILKEAVEETQRYINFIYAQPRESNQDNNAFLTINKTLLRGQTDAVEN
jgi:hypothetical protein